MICGPIVGPQPKNSIAIEIPVCFSVHLMVHVLFTVNIFCLSAPMVVVLTFFHKLFFLTCVAKNLHKYLPHCFLLSIQKVLPMSSFLCYSNPQRGMDFKIILCETAFLTSFQAAFETTTLEKRACMFYVITEHSARRTRAS